MGLIQIVKQVKEEHLRIRVEIVKQVWHIKFLKKTMLIVKPKHDAQKLQANLPLCVFVPL